MQRLGFRSLVAGSVVALLGCVASPNMAAGAATATAGAGQVVTQGPSKEPANAKPPGRQADSSLAFRGRYANGSVTFEIDGVSNRSYDLAVSTTGDVAAAGHPKVLTLSATGHASLAISVVVGSSRSGSVTATLTPSSGELLVASGSVWLAPTKGGGVAQGASRQAANLDAIRIDEPTAAGREAALREMHRASSDQVQARTSVGTQTSSLSGTARVQGTATYKDWNRVSRPARHVTVTVLSLTGGLGTTETNDQGDFSIDFDPSGAIITSLAVSASSPAGRVGSQGLGYHVYSQDFDLPQLDSGDTWTGSLDLGRQDASGNAFVIHDALWSAHLFASIAGGQAPPVDVTYPGGDTNEAAYANDSGITLGAYEWSAWDVVNHEYGHTSTG